MKYYTRLKKYKASNVEYDCTTGSAWSYGWWQFMRTINGVVIFNNYPYSHSTRGHQNKVKSLLTKLNIKIDVEIETYTSLSAPLGDVLKDIESNIKTLQDSINKIGSHKRKNIERQAKIDVLTEQICLLKKLYKKGAI